MSHALVHPATQLALVRDSAGVDRGACHRVQHGFSGKDDPEPIYAVLSGHIDRQYRVRNRELAQTMKPLTWLFHSDRILFLVLGIILGLYWEVLLVPLILASAVLGITQYFKRTDGETHS